MPNSKQRALVTPAKRGNGNKDRVTDEGQTSTERHAAMTWTLCLKRVLSFDVQTCGAYGSTDKIIACIEDSMLIKKIHIHLRQVIPIPTGLLPEGRASPHVGLFDEFNSAIHQTLRHLQKR